MSERGLFDPEKLPVAKGERVQLEGIRKQALETGRNRLLVTAIVLTIAFLAIVGRLVDLTVLNRGGEPTLARAPAPHGPATGRADIVDRNGIVLAISLPVVSLYANPREVLDADEAATKLAQALPDLSREEILAKLTSRSRFVWLRRNLTPQQQYEVNRLGLPGLAFQRAERRVYPHGSAAAHVLGFTDIDGRGISGVERSFDRLLAESDEPLRLSLDIRFQDIVRDELVKAMEEFRAIGAAGLVLDPHTGEVLAMVSLPDFDPNNPGSLVAEVGFNRVTKGVYEMGSTFKLFTLAMALDSGTVGLNDGYDASKPIRIARFTISDFQGKNRWLSVPEILVYSSNIGTAKMALDVGGRLQQTYLAGFGMLRPATVELPEVGAPLVPSRWRDINTMTIAYGHGLAVSPLQLADGVAAIVNGGVLRPATILKQDSDKLPPGHRAISEETSRVMRELMRLVVLNGTGKKANVKGYDVGGKTGTADKQMGRGYRKDARLASFVGAFPIHAPRFVILAMLDEPKGNAKTFNFATGGWVAAPVVARLIERLAPLTGIAPEPDDGRKPALGQTLLTASTRRSEPAGGERFAAH